MNIKIAIMFFIFTFCLCQHVSFASSTDEFPTLTEAYAKKVSPIKLKEIIDTIIQDKCHSADDYMDLGKAIYHEGDEDNARGVLSTIPELIEPGENASDLRKELIKMGFKDIASEVKKIEDQVQ